MNYVQFKLLLTIFGYYCVQCGNSFENSSRNSKSFWSFSYGDRLPNKEYDYIIVGAGNAGCVLANRLTENPKITVLLLEVGKPEIPLITDIPLLVGNLQSTSFNYGYVTEPQTRACLGLAGKRCNWPHGKGVGGSSIINYMIWTRGNKKDYNDWSKAGNAGWSFNEVLPYLKRIEKANLKEYQHNGWHGFDGPVSVEDCPFRSKIARTFVKSAKAVGYSQIDLNGGQQVGVSFLQQHTQKGWRVTSGKAYLQPVAHRKNLHVLTESQVTKILLEKDTKTAKGVEFLQKQRKFSVVALREVILSAGSFESPKLLMLSGIGPADHLQEMGIDVLKDLPVGQTLFDHVSVIGPLYTVDTAIDDLLSLDGLVNPEKTLEFFAGKGPFTTNGIESILFLKTNLSDPNEPDYPDIELMQVFSTVAFDSGPGLNRSVRLTEKTYDSVFRPLLNKRSFQFMPTLLHPRSKGHLKLKSKNPFDHPLLYGNFFDDDHDLETLVAGIREAIRIGSQEPFMKIGAKLYNAVVPGCEGLQFNSHKYWRCYAMHLTTSFHHQVGTCKMGPSTDPTAVVDHKLRVHGINNLRVVDTGIIPFPPSGHTSAFSFLIGERASDFIKEDWKNLLK